jgi:anti-sigma-K factor RskA
MAAAEDELDILAGEYAIGALPSEERAALEQRLAGEPELARRVAEWETRLAPLSEELPALTPPPEVWQRIRRSIAQPPRPAARAAWWDRLGLWRGWAVTATAAALALLGWVLATPPPAPGLELLAVLDDPNGRPLWVIQAAPDASRLIARPLEEGAPAGRVPELWLLREGQVISLGILASTGTSEPAVQGPARGELRPGDRLAVSIEPPGGSPTGRATGPVVSRGGLVAEPL